MMIRRFTYAVAAAVVLCASAGHAMVLCRARSARVVVRTKCRKGERVLDASQLDLSALAGARGAAGTAGQTGTYPLALVDSQTVELGEIRALFATGAAFVAINHPALGTTVMFDVVPQGYTHNIGGAQSTVYYTTADCSGVPYLLFADASQPFAQVYGTVAYVPTGAQQQVQYQSGEYDPDGDPCGVNTDTGRGTCCTVLTTDTANLSTAARVPLSALGFVPPFRVVPR